MDDRVLLVRYRDGDLTGAETERVSRRLWPRFAGVM
jgi:hypothetical protein